MENKDARKLSKRYPTNTNCVVLEDGSSTTFVLDPLQDPKLSALSFCSEKTAQDGTDIESCVPVAESYFKSLCADLASGNDENGQQYKDLVKKEDEHTTWLPNFHSGPSPQVGYDDFVSSIAVEAVQRQIRPAPAGQ